MSSSMAEYAWEKLFFRLPTKDRLLFLTFDLLLDFFILQNELVTSDSGWYGGQAGPSMSMVTAS